MLGFRGKLAFEPASMPSLSALVGVEYERGQDIGFDSWSWGRDSTVFAPDGIERNPRDRLYGYAGGQPVFNTRDYSITLDVRKELDGGGELRSITAHGDSKWDETFQSTPVFGFENMLRDRWSQDIIFTSESNAGLDAIVGFNYTREDAENSVSSAFLSTTEARRSSALFADLTYHVNDYLRILAGGRFMRSVVQYDGGIFFLPVAVDQRKNVFLPKLGVAADVSDDDTLYLVARRGFNPGGGSVDFFAFTAYEYGPEYVWTYEAGYRGSFVDDRVSLSAVAFYNDYDDYQFDFSPNPFQSRVENYDGQTYGLEVEVRAKASDTVTIGGALGLLRTEVDAPGLVIDGNDFGEDPPLTLSANVLWQATPTVSLDARVNYVDEYFSDFLNTPGTEAGDYVNIDMGITYRTGPFQIRGYVRNLTDHYSYHNKATSTPDGAGYLLPPREIGLKISADF